MSTYVVNISFSVKHLIENKSVHNITLLFSQIIDQNKAN